MRALYIVVGTMTKDHSSSLIISWFSSASLTALTKEDGSHHRFVLECDRLRPLHFALGLHGLISEGRALAESSSCHHEAGFPHPKTGSNQARNLLFLKTDGESFCTAR